MNGPPRKFSDGDRVRCPALVDEEMAYHLGIIVGEFFGIYAVQMLNTGEIGNFRERLLMPATVIDTLAEEV